MKNIYVLKGAILTLAAAFSSTGLFAQVFTAGDAMPSFKYDGKAFDKAEWKAAKVSKTKTADGEISVSEYLSPDRAVKLILTVKDLKKYNVIEWLPELENVSNAPSGKISDFKSLDWRAKATRQNVVLRRHNGTTCRFTDFMQINEIVGRIMNPPSEFGSDGCSSRGALPFFAVDYDAMNGVLVGIGWSSTWRASVSNYFVKTMKRPGGEGRADCEARYGERQGKFSITAGLPDGMADFRLSPGEKIRMPSIFVANRINTSVEDAQNLHRRFMLAHHSPKNSKGEIIKTPFSISFWGAYPQEYTLKIIGKLKKYGMPFDVIWQDAAWNGYDLLAPADWWDIVGYWRVNRKIFPDGIRAISNAAHDAGYKNILWFEMERTGSNTPVFKEHPEYFTSDGKIHMINLDEPKPYKYLFNAMRGVLDEENIDYLRIDFNILKPMKIWRKRETPDTRGLAEIRHINALYKFIDELRAARNNMLVDNCASGGRRLDFEMASRSIPLWRSDVQCIGVDDYDIANQIQSMNLLKWLPLNTGGVNDMHDTDDYSLLSGLSGGMTMTFNAHFSSDEDDKAFKPFAARLRKLRRVGELFYGDFYPLFKDSDNPSVPFGYQLDDPDGKRGCIVVLNRKFCAEKKVMVNPRKLNPNAKYELEDWNGKVKTVSGRELENLLISLPEPRSFAVLFYKKL